MKIRNGFVSNSSSTSFCICGMVYEGKLPEDIEDLIKSHNNLKSELDPSISTYYDPNCEDVYVGIDIENMESFETRSEFEQRCKRILQNVFPELKGVYFHYDGWYNG